MNEILFYFLKAKRHNTAESERPDTSDTGMKYSVLDVCSELLLSIPVTTSPNYCRMTILENVQ